MHTGEGGGRDMYQLRVARATDQLQRMVKMYVDGLSLQIIGSFEDHNGFDGVMVGHPKGPYHIEFTKKSGCILTHRADPETLLVFYIPAREEWLTACSRMESAGFRAVSSFNPYWDQLGRTFEDLDGYRVVLQNMSWDR